MEMKHFTFRKKPHILRLLLIVVLLLSFVLSTTAAVYAAHENKAMCCGEGSYVAEQTEDDHDTVSHGSGGADYYAQLEKWATLVENTDDVFDINLKVTGNTIASPRPIYLVIVTDLSGSMQRNYTRVPQNFARPSGLPIGWRSMSDTPGEASSLGYTYNASESYDIDYSDAAVGSNPFSYTRLQQAQDAAYTWIDQLLPANSANRIALASYYSRGQQDHSFTDDKASLKTKIASYSDETRSWTNHLGGLAAAYQYMDAAMKDPAIMSENPEFAVLFLSDGKTTYEYDSDAAITRDYLASIDLSGDSVANVRTESNASVKAQAAASAIQGNAGEYPVTIYSVSIGKNDVRPLGSGDYNVEIPDPDFLTKISSDGTAFEPEVASDNAAAVFEEIGKNLLSYYPTIDADAIIQDVIPKDFKVLKATAYGINGSTVKNPAITQTKDDKNNTVVAWSDVPQLNAGQSVMLVIQVQSPITCTGSGTEHTYRDTNNKATLTYTNVTNDGTNWVVAFPVPAVHVPAQKSQTPVSIPQTGDQANGYLYGTLLLAGLLGAVVLIKRRIRV